MDIQKYCDIVLEGAHGLCSVIEAVKTGAITDADLKKAEEMWWDPDPILHSKLSDAIPLHCLAKERLALSKEAN